MPHSLPRYLKINTYLIIGLLTLAGCAISTFVALAINILALACLPVFRQSGAFAHLRAEPAMMMFGGAFVILGASIALRLPDMSELVFIVNFLPLLLAMPVYLVARNLAGKKIALIVVWLCLAGTIVALGVGLYDINIRQYPRVQGFFTGALIYARLALLFGFIAAGGILLTSGWQRIIFALGPLFGIIACFLAGARGMLVSFPFLFIWFFVVLILDPRQKQKWWVIIGITAAAFIAILSVSFLPISSRASTIVDTIIKVFAGQGGIGGSTQIRLALLEEGWKLFLDQPFWGYGWNQLGGLTVSILNARNISAIPDLPQFHNDFLNFAIAFGLPGILALAMILAAPVTSALKSPRDSLFWVRLYATGILSLLYLTSGVTDITFGYDMPTTAYVIMSAIILGGFREKADFREPI